MTEQRYARMSMSREPYACQHSWEEGVFIQGGDGGIVFTKEGAYETAFFEAFPDTFIRGEGKTIQEAETDAWTQHQRHLACSEHEFERRNYTNGLGFCKHCSLSRSKAFPSLDLCEVCGADGYCRVGEGEKKTWRCLEHAPQDVKDEAAARKARMDAFLNRPKKDVEADIEATIKALAGVGE